MQCRPGCGACCIAPSITSAIPGMPNGKKAGERCIHLDSNNLCKLFNDSRRPEVCQQFRADSESCGETFEQAMLNLQNLEIETGAWGLPLYI